MLDCLCALTFFLILDVNSIALDSVYGEPLRCVQGSFYFNGVENALVFRRQKKHGFEEVAIPLPAEEVKGRFSVFYCWGQNTAYIGADESPVIFTWLEQRAS